MAFGLLNSMIWTVNKVMGLVLKKLSKSDKFNLLVLAFALLLIFDQLYNGMGMIQISHNYISNYEESIAILLSALLVLLYKEQQETQDSQKDLLKRQTKLQEAQHQPILIFKQIWLEDDDFQATIKNVGNGPALNMYLFMGSGEPELDPKRIRDSSDFINGDNFTNSISPSPESSYFSTTVNYDSFPRSEQVNKRINEIAKDYDMSPGQLQGRPTVYLSYSDVSGESHYVKLIKVVDNVPSDASYEGYLTSSDLHDLAVGRKDVSISNEVWGRLS